jgi:hypothetical protein
MFKLCNSLKSRCSCLIVIAGLLIGSGRLGASQPAGPIHELGFTGFGGFDDAVANSVTGFSGQQGQDGWSYGAWRGDGDYAPERFAPFERFDDGQWRQPESSSARLSATLFQTGTEPSRALAPIRRWRPAQAGSVRLVGGLRKSDPTAAASCKVYVNGKKSWETKLAADDTIPHAFDILLLDVPADAAVDMIVRPERPGAATEVAWAVQILSEPCTAWRPDLPIGPQFTAEEKQGQREAGQRILAELQQATATNRTVVTIPAGDYRFSCDGTTTLTGLTNLTINAQDVTFWFEPPFRLGLKFADCRNVTLQGLTIDCDPLPFFQGRIRDVAPAAEAPTFTIELMPGYQPIDGNGKELTNGTQRVAFYRPDGSYIRNPILNGKWSRHPNSNLVELQVIASPGREAAQLPGVGDYVACTFPSGHLVQNYNCGEMIYEDVNIYASAGMVLNEYLGPGGNLYKRVRLTRRPGTNRLHMGGRDGFHFNSGDKGAVLDRCEAAYLGDDEVNIHGTVYRLIKRLSPDHYVFFAGPNGYSVGERLDFYDWFTLEPLGQATVKSATRGKGVQWGHEWDVVLDRAMDLPDKDVMIIFHHHVEAGFVIRNCWFHDTGQRFLINGAPNGLVENNTFQNIGSGMIAHMETAKWAEGPFPSGVVLRNNRLLNTSFGIVVNTIAAGGRHLRRSTPIKDIRIQDNYFDEVGNAITVSQVDGLLLEGNVINRPFAHSDRHSYNTRRTVAYITDEFPPEDGETFPLVLDGYGDPMDAPIYLAGVRNARVQGNQIYDPQNRTAGREIRLGALTSNVVVNGQAQWNAVADTVSSWYPTPDQGARGWHYGTAPAEALRQDAYRPEQFAPLPVEQDGWRPAAGQTPFIGRILIQPSKEQAAVRRWISTVAGTVRVEGVVQTVTGHDGTVVYLFADGVEKWQQDASDGQPHNFDVRINGLKVGSTLDFVVAAKINSNKAATILYAKILTPPNSSK